MFVSTHALLGIVISQHVNNVPVAFGLGLLSHYILDMIPHGDESIGQWVKKRPLRGFIITISAEIILLSSFIITVHLKHEWPRANVALAGLMGAILPDILWYSYDFYRHYLVKRYPKSQKIIRDILKLENFFEHHSRLHAWFHQVAKKRINFFAGIVVQGVIVFLLLLLAVRAA